MLAGCLLGCTGGTVPGVPDASVDASIDAGTCTRGESAADCARCGPAPLSVSRLVCQPECLSFPACPISAIPPPCYEECAEGDCASCGSDGRWRKAFVDCLPCLPDAGAP